VHRGPKDAPYICDGPVRKVVQIRREIARRDRVEVVVVPVNPVDGRAERFVASVFGREVADAQPERNVRMAGDDAPRVGKRAVDIA
jgi:hypothetical protein